MEKNLLTRTMITRQPNKIYHPELLLNYLKGRFKAANDARLARRLGVNPSVISRLRNRKMPVSAAFLLLIYDETGISIADLKKMVESRIGHTA
jgi:transcriptional regulator with XRE-family HTH domain